MTKTEKRVKFFERFAQLTRFASDSNIHFLVTCFYRTAEEQLKMYHDNKSKCDGITNRSSHQDWLAIDIVIVDEYGTLRWGRNNEYEALGSEWKEMGGIWGGDWASLNDIYHFQWKDTLV